MIKINHKHHDFLRTLFYKTLADKDKEVNLLVNAWSNCRRMLLSGLGLLEVIESTVITPEQSLVSGL